MRKMCKRDFAHGADAHRGPAGERDLGITGGIYIEEFFIQSVTRNNKPFHN